MKLEECLRKNLIRKREIRKEEIEQQIEIAQRYLKKAKIIFESEIYDVCLLTAYISIFHSARAMLYKKGYKERSHFCLFEFIKQEFKNDGEVLRLAEIGQQYRETRHMVQYEGNLCSIEGAEEIIKDARLFLKAAKRII